MLNLLLLSRHPELVSGSHYKRSHTTNINTMLKSSPMRCWNKFSMTSSLLPSSISCLPSSINLLLLSRHPELVSGLHYKRFHTTNINTMLKSSPMRCWINSAWRLYFRLLSIYCSSLVTLNWFQGRIIKGFTQKHQYDAKIISNAMLK